MRPNGPVYGLRFLCSTQLKKFLRLIFSKILKNNSQYNVSRVPNLEKDDFSSYNNFLLSNGSIFLGMNYSVLNEANQNE